MSAFAKAGAFLVVGTLLSTGTFAERKYSDWSLPVNLGATLAGTLDCTGVNSASDDQGPAISKNGLSLYFGSNRAAQGAQGAADLYVAQRPSPDATWGPAQNLGTVINSPLIENIPALSRDGHWIFFNSNRPGGFGDIDLWAAFRDHVHDDFAWRAPLVNLGAGVNSAGFEAGASYFENEDGGSPLLFFGRGTSQANQATTDIWVSELQPDGTFGNAHPVPDPGFNSPQGDQRPSIRFDGLEIFFFSTREGSIKNAAGLNSADIWVATRNSVNDAWNTPANLGVVVNTEFGEIHPYISADGLTLFFASTRPGGCGGNDLYMSTRTQLKGKQEE
jgi:hypothetical protein